MLSCDSTLDWLAAAALSTAAIFDAVLLDALFADGDCCEAVEDGDAFSALLMIPSDWLNKLLVLLASKCFWLGVVGDDKVDASKLEGKNF